MIGGPAEIAAINALDLAGFVGLFGDIAEASPWIAERAAKARPFADRQAMITAFARAVESASEAEQLALLRAHPDLAGRAAMAGAVAVESIAEQASAGLNRLTPEAFARFTALNARYRAAFGFPFILAVRNADAATILAAFEARVANDPAAEFATALEQVRRIIRFRIESRVTV